MKQYKIAVAGTGYVGLGRRKKSRNYETRNLSNL